MNEEKLNLLDEIKKEFACGEKDVNAYSPLALAYIGDDVYDVVIRTLVVEKANRPAHELHREAVKYVKASAQAAIMDRLLEDEGLDRNRSVMVGDDPVNDASMAVLNDMDCILLNTSERSKKEIDEVVDRTVEERGGSYHGCVTVVNTISDINI